MPRQTTPTTFSVTCSGLDFTGTALFYPGRPGQFSGPPEKCYPDEPDEVEILTLLCGGKDAMFLLESDLGEDIQTAIEESFEPDDGYEEPGEDDEEELP